MNTYAGIPSTPAARREWIKFLLRSKGMTLASLAREHGQSRQSVSLALYRENPFWEKIIADKIGIPVSVLWPERYGATPPPHTEPEL